MATWRAWLMNPWLLPNALASAKDPDPAAARHVGNRLIVAEAGKHGIRAREVVVQTNVKLGFVQLAHGFVNEVESGSGVVGVWRGVEVDQRLSDGIKQASGNFVTGCSWLPGFRWRLPAEGSLPHRTGNRHSESTAGFVDAPIIFGLTITSPETGLPNGSALKSPVRMASEGSKPVKVRPRR